MKHEYTDTQLQAAIDGACNEAAQSAIGWLNTLDLDPQSEVWAEETPARLDLIKSALAALPEPEPSLSKLRPLSEAAEPADPYAELKKAHAAGKVIQINCCTVEQPHWVDLPSPAFFGKPHEYRIKPEPSTFEAHGKTWTRHKPGDPMPCDGQKMVTALLEHGDIGGTGIKAIKFDWGKRNDEGEIIGWRYADEPTPEPLESESCTPKVGDVVMLKSGGPKMTIRAFDRDEPMKAWCHWFKDEKSCAETFPTTCLQPV